MGVVVVVAACSTPSNQNPSGGGGGGKADGFEFCTPSTQNVAVTPAFGGLTFVSPVAVVQGPAETPRWYVVEKRGIIWTFEASATGDMATTPTIFADLEARVNAVRTRQASSGSRCPQSLPTTVGCTSRIRRPPPRARPTWCRG
jgi:hypothetical protein